MVATLLIGGRPGNRPARAAPARGPPSRVRARGWVRALRWRQAGAGRPALSTGGRLGPPHQEPYADIHTLLGEAAESLLEHECKTFERESLTLPGPDFVDRALAAGDRSPQVEKHTRSNDHNSISRLTWGFQRAEASRSDSDLTSRDQ